MRGLLATVLFLLLNLQPLAGGALCQLHHQPQGEGECGAAMQQEMAGMPGQHAVQDDDGKPPMTDDCATVMACATPAPVAAGTPITINYAAPVFRAEAPHPVAHQPDPPAAVLFRPPIV